MTNPFNKKGFTLVELMIVVAIIGILAALAIPAFLRYIKTSKAAEAEANMKKMAEGGKAYMTSEQKFVPAADGDQPWHAGVVAMGVASSYGMPVAFTEKVFPGGDAGAGDFCSLADSNVCDTVGTSIPQNGSKLIPTEPTNVIRLAAANKIRISFEDPTYFGYEWASLDEGEDAKATVKAYADFDSSTATFHTVQSNLSVDSETQEAILSPAYVINEFE